VRDVHTAQRIIYNPDPMWLQWAEVITAAVLFISCGLLVTVVWLRRRSVRRRAERAEIRKRIRRIQHRHGTSVPEPGGKHALRTARTPQESRKDDTNQAAAIAQRSGKHRLRTEDDYPTARIPIKRRQQMDDTVPILSPIRPYIDKPRYGRRP
jgi:hypothetical protein